MARAPRDPRRRPPWTRPSPGDLPGARREVSTICPGGLDLGEGAPLPLRAGAMHYFHHPPSDWAPGLDAMVSMGLKLVDVYVPWGRHEVAAGRFDFGERNPSLDVARFLRMASERGLKAVLRPGPHINAELTYFGLPEPRRLGPRVPGAHAEEPPGDAPDAAARVPGAELRERSVPCRGRPAAGTRRWAAVLAPLCHPHGPIVLVQVDNEGALYFRDGPYDQDYHPDAIRLLREFLADKYASPEALAGRVGAAGPHLRARAAARALRRGDRGRAGPPRRLDGVPRAPPRARHGALRDVAAARARSSPASRRCTTSRWERSRRRSTRRA